MGLSICVDARPGVARAHGFGCSWWRIRGTDNANLGLVIVHLAELREERHLGGITPDTDPHDRRWIDHAGGIKHMPTETTRAAEEGLDSGYMVTPIVPWPPL